MEEDRFRLCFDCLQRRIESDFSKKIVFCHGISDSSLPFGSSAVVELTSSSGGGDGESSSTQSQFILTYVPARQCHCLSDYVDEFIHGDSMMNVDHTVVDGTASRNEASYMSGGRNGEAASRSWENGSGYLPNDNSKKCSRSIGSDCQCCSYSHKYSFDRMINALAPVASVGFGCYSNFEDLASDYLSGALEDHILVSLSLLIEGKATGRDSLNFLNVIGMPGESTHPGCLRHPNIIPVIGILKSLEYRQLVYMHGLEFAHGSGSVWCLEELPCCLGSGLLNHKSTTPAMTSGVVCCENDCAYQGLDADLMLSLKIDWHAEFKKWWNGELSNFEYLLILNRLAGRRWGDHTFYPVMPWVVDFSTRPDESARTGWRDLSKSKWRLAKGDEQLDFTYLTSEVPHHVSDECLSELAVCSYKARRHPLSVLRLAVRSVYEPNEYPSTMQRLYQWTPDECIPEFYSDSQIFHSMHSGMADLSVPAWAGTTEEFFRIHRAALESDRVSSQIHNWIDITFGYKMSGDAAIAAKNVMLASSELTVPRYSGRRQLFTQPHPVRRGYARMPGYEKYTITHQHSLTDVSNAKGVLPEATNLQELEAASKFADHARYLTPVYPSCLENSTKGVSSSEELTHCGSKEDKFKDEDASSMVYPELLLWRKKISQSESLLRAAAEDIFSFGCVLAELILRRPLYDPISFPLHVDNGIIPYLVQELPPPARVIVEACIQKDCFRRPSAKSILESPYFPSSVSSAYLFLAPLQLIAKDGSRLRYVASFVKQGALKAMGTFAAERCALSCLPLVLASTSDTEAEWACIVLKEFLKCLTPSAVKTQVLPCILKILQTPGFSHLKVSILQDSFVREIWNQVGKHVYLDTVHPVVLSNLHISPYKSCAAAAAVLLIGSCEELGIPITIHQVSRCSFSRTIQVADGMDALVRIGGLLGDSFIVGQMIPLLKQVAYSYISISGMNRPEPVQSWSGLALIDCLVTLHGLILLLPREVIVKEIFEGERCLHVTILMQSTIEISVLQVAGTSLLAVCERIGPDLTAAHVLPQIKELFDGLAFSHDTASMSGGSTGKIVRHLKSKSDWQTQIESRMDLVLLLYPSLASILGIEKVRQCCATWLLLEQFLLRCHNWKWEQTGIISKQLRISHCQKALCDASFQVVNDICVLSTDGMIASGDGTIHVWNSRTGKLASVVSETSTNPVHISSNPLIQSGNSNDQINMLNSSGILTGTFDGSLYTCMHHLEFNQKLLAGTGNGFLRFIDIAEGIKLHSLKGDSVESGFPSLVSAICSSVSDERSVGSTLASPCWTAAGLSSGYCRLFDLRCGDAISSWQLHDGYITKLAAVEGHLLVSSSLDRTLRVWDLRRSPSASALLAVFRGHTDGVSSFSLWGQDVVSISRNKIGLSSLSKSFDEDGVHRIFPQKLRMGNQGARNMSVLSSISILPFSRLFIVGTEDGYLRICC
ncbi:hypothetical protein MLD38_017925 [Melastoma candidum]|uniref:Uncharacterized protein n=1 Tax=Melastoma candidum TaxID=119954 RepID=A0ACB9QS91_9MYRT|nr:hypothetical protein MLD38_017925 [Melastoma candidum]